MLLAESIKVNGRITKGMARAHSTNKLEHMKVRGREIKPMAMESCIMIMVKSIRVFGRTTRGKEKELCFIPVGRYTRENGWEIWLMGEAYLRV